MRVWSLGQEDPLEKESCPENSCPENPMDRGAWQPTARGSQRAGHGWATKHTEGYQILHQKFLGFRNNMNPMLLVPEFASFQYVGSESPDCLCRQIFFVYTAWKWKSLSHVRLFVTLWTVHSPWILQARILEWVAFPFSSRSSQPRDQTQVSLIAGGFFTSWATREAPTWHGYPLFQWLNPGGRELLLLGFLGFVVGHATMQHIRCYFPNQGSNPCPLQWKCGVSTTGWQGRLIGGF